MAILTGNFTDRALTPCLLSLIGADVNAVIEVGEHRSRCEWVFLSSWVLLTTKPVVRVISQRVRPGDEVRTGEIT